MAEIPLKRVLFVSSEDPRFPASGLLSPGLGGHWRSGRPGEKQISAVLELGGGPIHSLQVGNDGSAFVEILVGSEVNGDFQVLLPPAAFLTPQESRGGSQLRRVRSFGAPSLGRGEGKLVKLVCSQPYCQSRPFGLSFVRFFSPPEGDADPQLPRLGPFSLRGGGSSPRRPPGASFYQRLEPPPAPPGPSYAAAALGATTDPAPKPSKRPKTNGTKTPARTPGSPARTPGSSSRTPGSPARTPGSSSRTPGSPTRTPGSSSRTPGSSNQSPGSSSRTPGSSSRTPGSPARTPGSPLVGVVVALSGFMNPLRSQLRAAALGLGAGYRPDWSADCTHLVCAFPNTPKAARVRALGGVLVGPSWIWDCQKQQKRLPCGPYLLDGSASSGSEGEGPGEATPPPEPAHQAPPLPDPAVTPPTSDPTASDLDESDDQSERDPYGGSTEENSEEEEEEEEQPLPPLPDFFQGQTFFFRGSFPGGEGRKLRRWVIAFGGAVAPYMNDSVTHVVTEQDWDRECQEAQKLRPSLTFVRPHWLLLCGEQERPLPATPFLLGPAS